MKKTIATMIGIMMAVTVGTTFTMQPVGVYALSDTADFDVAAEDYEDYEDYDAAADEDIQYKFDTLLFFPNAHGSIDSENGISWGQSEGSFMDGDIWFYLDGGTCVLEDGQYTLFPPEGKGNLEAWRVVTEEGFEEEFDPSDIMNVEPFRESNGYFDAVHAIWAELDAEGSEEEFTEEEPVGNEWDDTDSEDEEESEDKEESEDEEESVDEEDSDTPEEDPGTEEPGEEAEEEPTADDESADKNDRSNDIATEPTEPEASKDSSSAETPAQSEQKPEAKNNDVIAPINSVHYEEYSNYYTVDWHPEYTFIDVTEREELGHCDFSRPWDDPETMSHKDPQRGGHIVQTGDSGNYNLIIMAVLMVTSLAALIALLRRSRKRIC